MKNPTFDYGTAQDLAAIINFCHELRTHPRLKKVNFDNLNSLWEFVAINEDEEPDHTVYDEPGGYRDEWDILRDLGFTMRDFI